MPSRSSLSSHFHPINADYSDDSRSSHEDLEFEEERRPLDLDSPSPETFFDLPPESFWLPQSHEQDWVNHNAIMQRKRSLKFNFASAANTTSFSSNRFWPSKTTNPRPILGPLKTQKSCLVVDGNHRRNKAGNGITRLFRSRSEPGGKLALQVSEPGSPRVSCMGRVAMEAATEMKTAKKIGIWRSFKSIFRNRTAAAVAEKGRPGFD
ncbi:hypothetical protein M9H77_34431 [Catharanthus roseus]|uniref:Uncharacterized protein n=1 Tax=Catharanthus roseus TaxID=4058 RepID=A0ACB9ZL68_CATRO|nr:hypothetical protein M9H77_34431 [Catharanthus roseus]